MTRAKLDPIDRHILQVLQADGRITNVDLSTKVGISAPPCLRRVRALEELGVIRGYHADIDPKALGYELTIFAMVGLSSQAEADLKAFETRVKQLPQVLECHMLQGEVDFILKCVAHDFTDFQDFLTRELTSAPNVSSVKTAPVIRQGKDQPGIPIDLDEPKAATKRASNVWPNSKTK
jgi:DNA-binding Lrp family transcriptional regulator